MLSRRTKALFWLAIAAVLVIGVRQVISDPTRPHASSSTPVVITEFMASNGGEIADEDGDHADWIEIHNRSFLPVDLEGWTLTDDPEQIDKWTFRSITLQADERLVVFASGKNRRTLEPEEGRNSPHTNFRLEADGGFLGLYSPTSRRHMDASEYTYPAQHLGISYGVLPDDAIAPSNMRYFSVPTPGISNDVASAWTGLLEKVQSSTPHGVYNKPITVSLTHPDPQAEIRYTTDGSLPSINNGFVYTEPISVQQSMPLRTAAFLEGMHPSPVNTQTYIMVDDVLSQDESPAGFPATWGTHLISIGEYSAHSPVEADYAMDARITETEDVAEALLSLPSVSLVMDMDDFTSLYSNPRERGVEWERPVSIEMLYPHDQKEGFQEEAGIRIQGGAGRWEFMPKHSFRLFFKQTYGASKLRQQVFEDSPADSFDTLVLRAGVDRSFAGHPSTPELTVGHRNATYLRDEWARATQIALSDIGSHGTFVHLYINGAYWGLYNLIERPDASFASTYLGGDKEDWFSVNHGGAVSGLPDRFHVLLQLAQEGDLTEPDRYATMLEFIDPEQFSDYIIANWYAGNYDWPENNWYVNVQNPAGRNLFFMWDAEGTWDNGAEIRLGPDEVEGAPYPNVVKAVFTALMENEEFALTFADRLYRHLHHGALTDEAAKERWNTLAQLVEPAIAAESARWGDVRYEQPITPDDWRKASADVMQQMEGNGDKLLKLTREAGYYPSIDPPQFSHPGGEFSPSLTLNLTVPDESSANPAIYYSLDGSDPHSAVSEEPSGLLYGEPLQVTVDITEATTVKARTYQNGEWSALAQASYMLPGQASDVRITEIMYHPVGDEEAEFLEITNLGDLPADLSSAHMEGIDFRFPRRANLEPGEVIVLIQDFKSFRRRYPEAEFAGVYEGKLSDGGERTALIAQDGSIITEVHYDDERGWPLSADGAGDSLELNDTTEPADNGSSWRASDKQHGTPGLFHSANTK